MTLWKKVGLSNSKSKTRRTSKSSASKKKTKKTAAAPPVAVAGASALAQALAVGHRPLAQLSPQDEALFRSFQSNLLSLISHELRTPLMGILNSLSLLEDGSPAGDLTTEELVRMARTNAQRLQQTLLSLLDLAALESGTFHARLKEVELVRLVQSRLEAHQSFLKDRGLKFEQSTVAGRAEFPLLADPQRFSRAVDLSIQAIVPRAVQNSAIQVRISSSKVSFEFELNPDLDESWMMAWTQALAGYQSGVASPTSAFGGVLQSEQAFLTRMEEGLGSEFMLVHEVMRTHHGSFKHLRRDRQVILELELPELSSETGLRAVLSSRAYQVTSELGSVALVILEVPAHLSAEAFRQQVKKTLFRSSDAVYALPAKGQVALVLDDCKVEDGPRLITRIEKAIGHPVKFGSAHCPGDGLDPSLLLELANKRLASGKTTG